MSLTVLRDVSLILLAAEAFLLALVPLLLFGGLSYGLFWLMRHERLPSWLGLTRAYVGLGKAYVELFTVAATRPIMAVHAALATVWGWLGGIARLGGGG